MNQNTLWRALRDLEIREYSGRGMNGQTCLAVYFENDEWYHVMADIVDHLDTIPDAVEAIRGMRMDSMGRGTILYWPRVAYTKGNT